MLGLFFKLMKTYLATLNLRSSNCKVFGCSDATFYQNGSARISRGLWESDGREIELTQKKIKGQTFYVTPCGADILYPEWLTNLRLKNGTITPNEIVAGAEFSISPFTTIVIIKTFDDKVLFGGRGGNKFDAWAPRFKGRSINQAAPFSVEEACDYLNVGGWKRGIQK